MLRPKIFAAYLPQYHETKDNNRFWGEGYTDWMAVRNAKPLFEGHHQPRVPLGENYYDLSRTDTIRTQAVLARRHHVDGFNIYHYWFKDGKQELEKPAEILRDAPEIDIDYFFTWDNTAWKRTWSNAAGNDWAPAFDREKASAGPEVLVEFSYDSRRDWEQHFFYLLDFFRDRRYFKINNRPVFMLMSHDGEETLREMGACWNALARENGFDGMFLATRRHNFTNARLFDTVFSYEPQTSAFGKRMSIEAKLQKYLGIRLKRDGAAKYLYDYEAVWKKIVADAGKKVKTGILCGVTGFDDTPRRGKDARILLHDSPDIFKKYFGELYAIAMRHGQELLLLTAWNEWGEGAYLEPDERNGLRYLEAVKEVVENT